MPLLFESTDDVVKNFGEVLSFSPGLGTDLLIFIAGVATGFIALPIVLPIAGYQLTKRWGPP